MSDLVFVEIKPNVLVAQRAITSISFDHFDDGQQPIAKVWVDEPSDTFFPLYGLDAVAFYEWTQARTDSGPVTRANEIRELNNLSGEDE